MKFNCGLSRNEKSAVRTARYEASKSWHSWFAWHPVRVASKDCRWLESVLRKRVEYTVQCCDGMGLWNETRSRWEYKGEF
jgi:hypothetical protein